MAPHNKFLGLSHNKSHLYFVTLRLILTNCRKMDKLPKDPMILFSTVNMLLRDNYSSLDELCDDMDVERAALEAELATAGFEYSEANNKFW